MKIVHEKSKCIGCGACVSICPEHFKMKEDGKAFLEESKLIDEQSDKYEKEVVDVGCAKEAADNCPVQCIEIKE